MRKTSLATLPFLLLGLMPIAAGAQGTEIAPGQLVKSRTSSSVYYIDSDLSRHAFPNAKVYASWYGDFNGVTTVNDDELAQFPLGANVPYKASKRLVKIATDPKVYAVDDGGVLRWVKDEATARALYGNDWNKQVDDLSDAFFAGYVLGANISSSADFDSRQAIRDIMAALHTRRIWDLGRRGAGRDDFGNFGFGKLRAAVCHDFGRWGKQTIYLPVSAAAAHVKHGDANGPCNASPTDEDTTAPTISGTTAADITANAATVRFTTSEKATARVYFSKNTPVNKDSADVVTSGAVSTSHSVNLSNLQASTKYYVLVIATDEAGNKTTAAEFSFTTTAGGNDEDTTAPTISNAAVDGVTATGAMINVTASENVTAKAFYAKTSPVNVGTAAKVEATAAAKTQHLTLTGLQSDTKYYVIVEVADAAGNKTISSELHFTTEEAADTTAPTLGAVTFEDVSETGAKAMFTANEEVTATVYYSKTSPVNVATAAHADVHTFAASQSVMLAGLEPETKYYVTVKAKDRAGNESSASAEVDFTTVAPDTTAPTISAVTAGSITATGATVTVTANEAVSVQVFYAKTTPVNVATAAHADSTTAASTHNIVLTGLEADTAYHVTVKATDAAGNVTTSSSEVTFETTAS